MKIFVTGGAGFIGRNLVSEVLKDHYVTIYDSLANSSENDIAGLIDSGAEFVKGDVLDYDRLVESCKNHDIMIHLAARSDVSESIQDPEATNRVNVTGTVNATKACITNNIKKIIFASSAAVYGECKDLPITELSQANPVSPYGKSKLAAESEIKKISKESGMYCIILRIFNVYGKGQNRRYSGVITKFLENIHRNRPLVIYGNGDQTRDFVSVRDVISAFESAMNHDKSGTYNIASGNKTSIIQLADTIMKLHSKKLEIIHKQKKTGDIKDSYADISLAKKELGFAVQDTLKDSLSGLV